MLNASCLCKWSRLSKTAIHDKAGIISSPNGESLIALVDTDPDEEPNTVTYDEAALVKSADEGYLSTSDNPLMLIAPGDVVELTVPNADGAPASRTMVSVKPTGDYGEDFHKEAAEWFSNLSAYPEGTYASAICVPPETGGAPTMLIHRDSPDGEWFAGSREAKIKRQQKTAPRSMRADAETLPKRYPF